MEGKDLSDHVKEINEKEKDILAVWKDYTSTYLVPEEKELADKFVAAHTKLHVVEDKAVSGYSRRQERRSTSLGQRQWRV